MQIVLRELTKGTDVCCLVHLIDEPRMVDMSFLRLK